MQTAEKDKTKETDPGPCRRSQHMESSTLIFALCAYLRGMSPPYMLYKAERTKTKQRKVNLRPPTSLPPPSVPIQSSRPSFGPMPHPYKSRRRRPSPPPRVRGTLVTPLPSGVSQNDAHASWVSILGPRCDQLRAVTVQQCR
jgi:hypothetical protein